MAADWIPPLVVLTAGAAAGALVVVAQARLRPRSTQVATPANVAASDLRRRYDALIRRLSEGVTPEERPALEIEAARTLRALETAEASSAATPTASPVVKQGSPWLGFVYGLATAGIIGGLIYFASQGSTERTAGGSVTGGGPMAPAGPSSTDGGIPALEDAVRKEPTRIEPRIELTRAYLQQRDLMKVFEQTKAILEIEPGNAHALTYQALVRVAMGQADQAEKMLETAIRTNPRIEDAYIHLAIARIQMGNRKGAEEAIAAGQKEFPDDKEALASVFAQITGAVDEKQAQTANGTPDGTGAPPPTSSGGPSESVVVVVDLPKGQSAPPNALLFVIVREAGFASGPPVAVKRVPATGFPLTITLSDKDSMAGESLPPLVRIDARIDGDGDPLTKNPRDPVASEDNVKRGTGQVRLVLSPPAS